MAATPDGKGYWLAAADGGVFAYGDAVFYGSAATFSHSPVVSITATPDGDGYWLAAADGGVFSFGDAHFFGSAEPFAPGAPVVGMSRTPDGDGYWLAAADGGVFSFGDGEFHGSAANFALGSAQVSGIAATPDGGGYWLSGSDGGVFAFGDAQFYGSEVSPGGWPDPIGGIVTTPDGHGYSLFLKAPLYDRDNPTGLSGYYLARANYGGSDYYSTANAVLFLDQAVLYLQLGERFDADSPLKPGYSVAISELQQLALIPEMVTPAQGEQFATLTAELDSFFHIPGFNQG
jgi:hypothetical protein